MTCKECGVHLYEYLDNSLRPDLSEAVRKHLDFCPACQEVYQQERELSRRFREAAARLDERLHFQFQMPLPAGNRPADAGSFRHPLFVKWVMASVLVGILIVSAMFLLYPPSEKSPDQMARLAKHTGLGGNQLRTGGEAKEENGTIQIISIEDGSAQLNETHFREESGGVITDITVEVTGLHEIDLQQTEGKEVTQ
jgi:hypothetical protein